MLVNAVKEQNAMLLKQQQQIEQQQQLNQQKDAWIASIQKELADMKAWLLKKPTTATSEGEAAQLWREEPNPIDGSTAFRYFIPREASSAQLKVYLVNGEE